MDLVDFGCDLQEAGDAPRALHTGSSDPQGRRMTDGGTVLLEDGFAPEAWREQINAWVAEVTHDRIQDLLPEGSAIAEMMSDYAVLREQARVC